MAAGIPTKHNKKVLKQKLVPYTVKSKNGVEYTKYKKVVVDEEAVKLHQALTNQVYGKPTV